MPQQQINFGAFPDDLNADAIRTAFQKVQQNFTELYNGETLTGVSFLQAGNGIHQNQTIGNVRIEANIANLNVMSHTLKIGKNGNTTTSAKIEQSADILVIDLNDTVAANSITTNTFTSQTANFTTLSTSNITTANATITTSQIGQLTSNSIIVNGNAAATSYTSTTTTQAPFTVASNIMVQNLNAQYAQTAVFAQTANYATTATSSYFSNQANIANAISGGNARQLLVQTAPSTTSFIAGPTLANTVLTWNGSSFIWTDVPPSTTNSINAINANYANYSGNAVYSNSANLANLADFVNNPIQTTITQVGNLSTLTVTGVTNLGNITVNGISNLGPVANVKISGGTAGQVLTTTGSGSIFWSSSGISQLIGDVSTTGTGLVPATLALTGVTAGTYRSITVDTKGRATAGSNPTTLAGYGITDAQPLDADLTAIGSLAGTSGILKKTAANTWVLDASGGTSASTTVDGVQTLINKTLIGPVIQHNVQVISANTTATASRIYVITASLTLTLPASPASGDWVSFANRSNTTTAIISRNGQNIMGLAENMTLDSVNFFGTLVYADATRGWIFN